jgi:hypothetical protein
MTVRRKSDAEAWLWVLVGGYWALLARLEGVWR